jgi:hypothetical protein
MLGLEIQGIFTPALPLSLYGMTLKHKGNFTIRLYFFLAPSDPISVLKMFSTLSTVSCWINVSGLNVWHWEHTCCLTHEQIGMKRF